MGEGSSTDRQMILFAVSTYYNVKYSTIIILQKERSEYTPKKVIKYRIRSNSAYFFQRPVGAALIRVRRLFLSGKIYYM